MGSQLGSWMDSCLGGWAHFVEVPKWVGAWIVIQSSSNHSFHQNRPSLCRFHQLGWFVTALEVPTEPTWAFCHGFGEDLWERGSHSNSNPRSCSEQQRVWIKRSCLVLWRICGVDPSAKHVTGIGPVPELYWDWFSLPPQCQANAWTGRCALAVGPVRLVQPALAQPPSSFVNCITWQLTVCKPILRPSSLQDSNPVPAMHWIHLSNSHPWPWHQPALPQPQGSQTPQA